MSTNRGKVFETELKKSIEQDGSVMIERVPDKVFWNGKRLLSQETKADFVAWAIPKSEPWLIKPMMIEAKATAQKRIDFSALQDHQEKALVEFEQFHVNMHSYVAVNFYDNVNIRRMNRCFMIPISVWLEYRDSGDRKSLPIATCESDERIVECPRVAGSIYDMTLWLESF